jgi:hypothetical protein
MRSFRKTGSSTPTTEVFGGFGAEFLFRVIAERTAVIVTGQQQVLDLEHYLDVLSRKPGALAGPGNGTHFPMFGVKCVGFVHDFGD